MISTFLAAPTLYGLCGAGLAGIGVFIVVSHPEILRKIVGFNMLGAGIFLVFGVAARRGAAAEFDGDPIPQAMVITGIVVAFSATALAIALLRRLFDLTGRATLDASSTESQSRSEP